MGSAKKKARQRSSFGSPLPNAASGSGRRNRRASPPRSQACARPSDEAAASSKLRAYLPVASKHCLLSLTPTPRALCRPHLLPTPTHHALSLSLSLPLSLSLSSRRFSPFPETSSPLSTTASTGAYMYPFGGTGPGTHLFPPHTSHPILLMWHRHHVSRPRGAASSASAVVPGNVRRVATLQHEHSHCAQVYI